MKRDFPLIVLEWLYAEQFLEPSLNSPENYKNSFGLKTSNVLMTSNYKFNLVKILQIFKVNGKKMFAYKMIEYEVTKFLLFAL